jgi:apolipoprotein N-acyltransferase
MGTIVEEGGSPSAPAAPATPERSVTFGGRVFCGLALGAVAALCFPPHAVPWLLPFALTGLFALLQDMTPRRAAYIGQAFGTVLAALALRWLWGMFGAAAVSLWALIGAFTAVTCSLVVWLRSRLPRVPFPLLAAIVWTGIEYFRSEPMVLNFGWLGVGYPLVDYALPCHIAAVIGSYGISFLVAGWCAWAATGRRLPVVALRLAPLFVLFAPFPASPAAPDPAHAFQVRLVQADSEDDTSMFRLSQSPANPAPQLIVWPELSYYSDPRPNYKLWKPGHDPHEKVWNRLRGLALDSHAYFLFGAKDQSDATGDADFRNTAFLLDPQGNLVGKHVKNHTVHFIKDGVAGTDAHVFPTPLGTIGVGICFDMDYPDVARRLVNNGAESLIVPSNNPLNWGPVQHAQHKQIFQMRAVECDRWLATTDIAGNTFLVAPTGQIVRSVQTTDPTTLDVTIGRLQTRDLFVRGGWRFGQICLTLLVLGCLWGAFRRAPV